MRKEKLELRTSESHDERGREKREVTSLKRGGDTGLRRGMGESKTTLRAPERREKSEERREKREGRKKKKADTGLQRGGRK